jgi:hypothetical protein
MIGLQSLLGVVRCSPTFFYSCISRSMHSFASRPVQTLGIGAKRPRFIRPGARCEVLAGYRRIGVRKHPARLFIPAAADPTRPRFRIEEILRRTAFLCHAVRDQRLSLAQLSKHRVKEVPGSSPSPLQSSFFEGPRDDASRPTAKRRMASEIPKYPPFSAQTLFALVRTQFLARQIARGHGQFCGALSQAQSLGRVGLAAI